MHTDVQCIRKAPRMYVCMYRIHLPAELSPTLPCSGIRAYEMECLLSLGLTPLCCGNNGQGKARQSCG